jgi:hypothetical protein
MDLTDFLNIIISFIETIFSANEMILEWLDNVSILGFSLLIWVYTGMVGSIVISVINSLLDDAEETA